jgi:hypothetical protein
VLEQKIPCRTKKSSTCLHLMMHIFMVHGFDPLVEEAVNRGKSRVKVLSPDPQLLRLGQLLVKPRGVVPMKEKLRFFLN